MNNHPIDQAAGPPDWERIDTVLLDLDGTLLDKYYDDFFWEDFLPRVYAERNGFGRRQAAAELMTRYRAVEKTLKWTDLDYWSSQLDLDIVDLKRQIAHLVAVLPGAVDFLEFLNERDKKVNLVTAAHPKALAIKMEQVGLARFFDRLVCADDLGRPKEDERFWAELEHELGYGPDTTLLADDNPAVLRAARPRGIAHLVHMARPSSRQPARFASDFISIASFYDLMER